MKNPNSFSGNKPANTPSSASTPTSRQTRMDTRQSKEEIARRAYFIYLDHGCPQGQDMQHWLEAEAQVSAARNPSRA